ncbi:Titin-like protein [Frankliniella fusca]|uniref:Titin-like protein n=1 Tax=Frankliniella fusca TaxID=407009 RepID=A0AAE1HD37_9NEOP|nr:Titin-like protein [Frankliniella fusca]
MDEAEGLGRAGAGTDAAGADGTTSAPDSPPTPTPPATVAAPASTLQQPSAVGHLVLGQLSFPPAWTTTTPTSAPTSTVVAAGVNAATMFMPQPTATALGPMPGQVPFPAAWPVQHQQQQQVQWGGPSSVPYWASPPSTSAAPPALPLYQPGPSHHAPYHQQWIPPAAAQALHKRPINSPIQTGTPAKRGRGRPRKETSAVREFKDETHRADGEPASLQPPGRSKEDVAIAQDPRFACATCELWVGRYILKPCYHYALCIACIEDMHKSNSQPACPACHTDITEYIEGFKGRPRYGYDDD